MSDKSRSFLIQLSDDIKTSLLCLKPCGSDGADGRDNPQRQLYVCPESSKKGKATVGGSKLNDKILQPRPRDYGGLGLARPSLYLPLRDPSFVPKFEDEFAEHIPGFFGKQRTKAMKKQLDGNMLWRRMAKQKKNGTGRTNAGGSMKNVKIDGKKLSDMTADERVEAMIKSGMI